MHYHAEIIMPPTEDVIGAVEKIMSPFSENDEEARHAFWDWYVIGGRYSGRKLEARIPQERMDAFYAELKKRGVTVSGVQFGKQELAPSSQIPEVDAIWRDMCPGAGQVRPMFKHSGDSMKMDICRVEELPPELKAYRVIVACEQYDGVGAEYMIEKSFWNGVTYHDTSWDGLVRTALQMHAKHMKSYRAEWAEPRAVKPDWLCVTVDYHS
jgi:hypothetical protein